MSQGGDPPDRRAPPGPPAPSRQRFDTAAHLASRRRAAARARAVRRRRALVALATVGLVSGIVAACNAVSSPKSSTPGSTGTSGPSSTAGSTTTTTTLPSAFGVGIHVFRKWADNGPHATHVGPDGVAEPGRVLVTEVRYPILGGSGASPETDAAPAHTGAPYPVIVFAHGFGTDPETYEGLLDTWVRAGFVVVAPVFPDENLTTVNQYGGVDGPDAPNLEADVYNEPGDLSFVLDKLDDGTGGWISKLHSVMDFGDIALAGQSDGANVVAALAFTPQLHRVRKALPSAPKAVAVLSGQEWENGDHYGASASSPALLQIQSDADACNPPSAAYTLYSALQADLATKWFDVLLGPAHLEPYDSTNSWATAVDHVTTKFFELELDWRPSTTSAAAVTRAGTVNDVSQITTTVSETTIPSVPPVGTCWTN